MRRPDGPSLRYSFDIKRHMFVCKCGFEVSENGLFFSSDKEMNKEADALTAHEIAHRMMDG